MLITRAGKEKEKTASARGVARQPPCRSGPVQQASLAAAIRISLNPFESNLQSKGNHE